ncbi:MAG: MFS transporter [Methanomassiliicoccales archaeon]|nr:MAG: MFS transporter [Methanomassiliicoccales archaeon]
MDSKGKYLSLVSYNHALTHGVVLSVPIAANYIQVESDMSYTPIFISISLFIFAYGVGAVFAGYLIDRMGVIKPMFIGMVLTTISMFGLSLSNNFQLFSFWILIAGCGLSFAHPSGLTLVSQLFVKNRGKGMGTFGFIGQFGQFVPPIAAAAIGKFFFWNYIFLVFLFLYICALIFCGLLLSSEIKGEDVEKPKRMEYSKALGALISGIVLLVLLLTAMRGNYYRAITSVLTYYSNDVLELDILTGAIFLSVMLLFGLPGHLLGGRLADRYGPIKPLVVFSVLAVIGILLCLSLNIILLVTGLCIVGFSFFSAQPAENVLTANVSSLNVRGTLYGLKFLVSFGFSFIALILIGVFGDIYSLTIAFFIILSFAVATLFSVLVIARTYKGPEKSKPEKDEKWDFE